VDPDRLVVNKELSLFGPEAGSVLRLIDFSITQLKAKGSLGPAARAIKKKIGIGHVMPGYPGTTVTTPCHKWDFHTHSFAIKVFRGTRKHYSAQQELQFPTLLACFPGRINFTRTLCSKMKFQLMTWCGTRSLLSGGHTTRG
jgi:hypothetical protein